jgi:DNA-directed RNA polymerase specialized sigma24 family protein
MASQWDTELGAFGPTQWSLVDRAGQSDVDARKVPLGLLVQRYMPALRAHLRAQKRLEHEQVEDILQGFVTEKVLEQNLIAQADREKGKFRSFLLVALNRYLIDQVRRANTDKRSGGNAAGGEDETEEGISREVQPSDQFDIAWAQELVAETLRRMRCECETAGQLVVWVIFECRVVRPAFDGVEPMPYEDLIERFRFESPIQAFNLLTTAKRKFARILRSVAGEYAGDSELIDQEINDLKSILSITGA